MSEKEPMSSNSSGNLNSTIDVTIDNFHQGFEELKQLLPQCSFFSIDTELTGIWNGTQSTLAVSDSHQTYYEKCFENSLPFLISQFGLCLFLWDDQEERFVFKKKIANE